MVDRLIVALGNDPHRFGVMELFDQLPQDTNPEPWATVLKSCLEGGCREGKSATVRELAVACADYPAAKKGPWVPREFRGFVSSVVFGEHKSRGRIGTAKMLADAAAWQPPEAA